MAKKEEIGHGSVKSDQRNVWQWVLQCRYIYFIPPSPSSLWYFVHFLEKAIGVQQKEKSICPFYIGFIFGLLRDFVSHLFAPYGGKNLYQLYYYDTSIQLHLQPPTDLYSSALNPISCHNSQIKKGPGYYLL